MLEYFANGTTLDKSLFLMLAGMAGVFSVLIIFFVLIKVLIKLFLKKVTINYLIIIKLLMRYLQF